MIRVLVTGGAGYIGSHACKALAHAGFLPVTFDNLTRGHRSAVRWGPLVHGDLADVSVVRRALKEHRIQAVLHFAALAYVGESMEQPTRYFRNNVGGTANLLDAMSAEDVDTIVFSSTCATYGIPERLPLDEAHPQRPINPYGESKLMAERMLQWGAGTTRDLRYVALRYFNAAGADLDGELGEDHDPETHLIPSAIEAALGLRRHIEVFGTDYPTPDGTAIRDYIHVTDLADAHVRALEHLLTAPAALCANLGTGTGYSVRQVIAAVAERAGRPVPVVESPRRAGDPPQLVAEPATARHVLGWTPRHSDLATIVDSAWHWHASRAIRRRAVELVSA